MVASNSRRQKSIRLLNRPLARSSWALPAGPAEKSTERPGSTLRSMQSLKLMGEDKAVRRSLRLDLYPKALATPGARRSASSRSVFTPICERDTARLVATKVQPLPRLAAQIARARWPSLTWRAITWVRSARMASAVRELVSEIVTIDLNTKGFAG